MIATSTSLSVLYTKKIVGKKRKGKVNVSRSVQKAVRKYKLK
jgi:hypothetical protein|tara:strand:+ start:10160 stop:10285 length:126 start_codon:yes stop_codon:yes gene_type:complete